MSKAVSFFHHTRIPSDFLFHSLNDQQLIEQHNELLETKFNETLTGKLKLALITELKKRNYDISVLIEKLDGLTAIRLIKISAVNKTIIAVD